MNRKNADQLIAEVLQNDRTGGPHPQVEDRLMYAFLLKSRAAKVRQNSLANFAGWIFSFQNFGAKAALVSLVVFFSLMNSQFTFDNGGVSAIDSLATQRVLLADSTHYIQNIDSIRSDSLN